MSRLIRGLKWLTRRRPARDEHGAVSAIVAITLSGGLLLGMSALVIDVGQLYIEREQLQTGADAASWKLAASCVRDPAKCTIADQRANAEKYAKANVTDGFVTVEYCIRLNGVVTCSDPSFRGTAKCVPLPATNIANYVEVHTSTLTKSGDRLVPPSFAGAVLGPGYKGKQGSACGRVSWGPPKVVSVFALGISLCDWKRMTNNNTTYYSPLGSTLGQVGVLPLLGQPAPGTTTEQAVTQNLGAGLNVLGKPIFLSSCTTPVVDPYSPRGYIWMPQDNTCMISPTVGQGVTTSILTAGLATTYCAPKLKGYYQAKQPILVPIYDLDLSSGLLGGLLGSLLYPNWRIVGFAPFVVTGWANLTDTALGSVVSILSGQVLAGLSSVLCKALASCIYGYFTKTVTPAARPEFGTGTTDFGAVVMGRTG